MWEERASKAQRLLQPRGDGPAGGLLEAPRAERTQRVSPRSSPGRCPARRARGWWRRPCPLPPPPVAVERWRSAHAAPHRSFPEPPSQPCRILPGPPALGAGRDHPERRGSAWCSRRAAQRPSDWCGAERCVAALCFGLLQL